MLKQLISGCVAFLCTTANAQTLFTYGDDSVSAPQFLAAYTKNNTDSSNKAALRNYLDLYIASRLKIKEAKERGYDTLPPLVADLAGLREQIIPTYLKDEAAVNRLVEEAMARSAKDIHWYHIFISDERNGTTDTVAALERAHGLLKKLETGEDFATVARESSDEPSAKTTGGNAGFITVFTLPYDIETIIYKTPVGGIAPLYRSKSGYHIFKNAGERPAFGTMKAAQILIAFPPDASAAAKANAKKVADSLYASIQKGADFGKLATRFSNDITTAEAGGQMPLFGVGAYDSVFENTVFALPKDGAVSKPFVTTHGYHIVKRLERLSIATGKNNAKHLQNLREKVETGDRMATTQQALVQKILKEARFRKHSFNEAALWAYSDSVLDNKPSGTASVLNDSSLLFTLGGKRLTTADWIGHAQTFRYKDDGTGVKSYPILWDEFVQATAMNYYKEHLEEYNEAFRQQLEEFKDGNLFFEIMQREVWNKAQEDTAALQTFYNAHAQNYKWNKSADAVIFYATDLAAATRLRAQLQKKPSGWKTFVAALSEKIAADSARFELSQIPNGSNQVLKNGSLTQPVVNRADNTASFALILKLYNTPSQRTFTEAKGLVVSDYQAALEKAWIADLKKKYPVVIHEEVLKNLTPALAR